MKKLLIDCTFISETKLNTGIQRVVRKFIENIDTVSLFSDYIAHQVVLENSKIKEISLTSKNKVLSKNIIPKQGDVLLLIDSTWHIDTWASIKLAKENGAKIIAISYDIIPISHPQFCDKNLVKLFKNWFEKAVDYVDAFIAISHTVQLQLQDYLTKNYPQKVKDIEFDYFLLGADFSYEKFSLTSKSIREPLKTLYKKNSNIYLIVCTIEPRKNHAYLLDVFDKLWENNIDVTLNIVGKVGWMVDKLINRIYEHPEFNKRLFHFKDLNDQELNYCYQNSKMLLFPSFIEGFGLPIIESLNNSLPVMASDIPIHREVGGDKIGYFDIKDTSDLVKKLTKIQKSQIPPNMIPKKNFSWIDWQDSTKMLFQKIQAINTQTKLQQVAQLIIDKNLDKTFTDKEYKQLAKLLKKEADETTNKRGI